MDNTRVFRMAFASVYPHYITKAEKKGRTKEEVGPKGIQVNETIRGGRRKRLQRSWSKPWARTALNP